MGAFLPPLDFPEGIAPRLPPLSPFLLNTGARGLSTYVYLGAKGKVPGQTMITSERRGLKTWGDISSNSWLGPNGHESLGGRVLSEEWRVQVKTS